MTCFYIKRKLVRSPVKTLCEGIWVLRPSGPLKLSDVTCPKCLKILITMQEKRLTILRDNLTEALNQNEMH